MCKDEYEVKNKYNIGEMKSEEGDVDGHETHLILCARNVA